MARKKPQLEKLPRISDSEAYEAAVAEENLAHARSCHST